MPMGIRLALIAAGAVVFLAFIWGVKGHFRSSRLPGWATLIAVLSILSFAAFVAGVLQAEPSPRIPVALVLQALSLALFASAVRATRATRLTYVGDDDTPTFLISHGPYRWVRHPFYTSYILFWGACAIMTNSILSYAGFIVMTIAYVVSATSEERKFAGSDLADEYGRYRQKTGLFWPKIF